MSSEFPFSTQILELKLRKAVTAYWESRLDQKDRQKKGGARDVGTRSEVTGGGHLDVFCHLACDVIQRAGFHSDHIRLKQNVDLPGYFRPTKQWDIVVVRDGKLCAAIEMKSQAGPSFGNNFNNRVEEAIGSSVDLWTAFREGALGTKRPWLGYLFFLEDAPRSRKPVRLSASTFPPMDIFQNTSYADRYGILCQRLVLERNYDAAALILSPPTSPVTFSQPYPGLDFESWAKSLYGHLIGCL